MKSATTGYQTDQYTEIRVHLLRQGLSQADLAKRLGVSVAYINDILKSKRKALHIRRRLVKEFGVPAELLNYGRSEAAA